MTINIINTPEKLNPSTIPLSGRHLIEASAGTGKTYNITKIYLRLLLESGLSVKQILVMTFTKAATEELRARIDNEVRNALKNWDVLIKEEAFFKAINSNFTQEQTELREARLKAASLELDEASIFTLHGFCSRALTSQAFSSGLPMDISMESDTSELLLESIRDWLRKINQIKSDFLLLKEKNWHKPDVFFSQFYRALTTSCTLNAPNPEVIQRYYDDNISRIMRDLFLLKKIKVLEVLNKDKDIIFSTLVNGKKDEAERLNEWQCLIQWLGQEDASVCPGELGRFINGNRYRGNNELKEIFEPLKQLKKMFSDQLSRRNKSLAKQIENNPVYQLVSHGITEIRQSFARDKEQHAMMDFDDLITCLSLRLQTSEGQGLMKELHKQYPVALVDEFQDTDPNQYAILDILYPKSDQQSALFMIGDPKQAIYAFRGGDIFTYLDARKAADYHWHMDTNWRSVDTVVTAYNRLFLGGSLEQNSSDEVFGYDIHYEKINSTDKAEAAKISFKDSSDHFTAINYCWLSEVANPSGAKGDATTDDFKLGLAQWCVTEISRLLTEAKLGEQSLQEKDIAILVRTGTEAQIMRNVLSNSGFPSVYLSEKENIFKSAQANELLLVLKGILESENSDLLVAALSTYLMGGTAEKLALYQEQGSEQAWEEQRDRAVQLRQIWQKKGCMSMLMQLIGHDYQPEPSKHERSLTNMIHLAELLQQASRQYKHPQQLLKWFTDQCQADNNQDEAQLRLESDENLIRIMTQHGSKGLEYPVVFIPFASAFKDPVRFGKTLHEYFEYHDSESYQAKCQVGQSDEAIELVTSEVNAETIRLLYVAITRAAYRCYLGVAPFTESSKSPLGLTLKLADRGDWEETLQQLVDTSDESSTLIMIDDNETQVLSRLEPMNDYELLSLSLLEHPIDSHWSLSSFSSLMRDSYSARQEQKDRSDEAFEYKAQEDGEKSATANSLRFSLRKGTDTGNLLHDILEYTNFSSIQYDWPLETPLRRFGGLPEEQQVELVQWLQDCLDTPLPLIEPASESIKLSDLSWSQTLRETEFYFPMNNMQLDSLSVILNEYRGGDQRINLPEKEKLVGMMRGFIDLIFEHNGRFYVVDYKSTHLGDQLKDYHWQALKENNQLHYYDLQYLIYSLALHRYLSLRITHYDPEIHFGGVYYLYLRGMSTQNNEYYGIFHTAIETSLLNQLEKAFQGEVIKEGAA